MALLSALTVLSAGPSAAHPINGKVRLAEPIVRGDINIRLDEVASGLTAPNWATSAPGIANHLFVSDQIGIIWDINLDTGARTSLLDVSADLVPLGFAGPGTFDERGLIGFTFHPDFATNGRFYTYTSQPVAGAPDFGVPEGAAADHHAVIDEWQVVDPANPAAGVDLGARRELLRVGEPQFNHNGGALAFGPTDNNLYIGFGDGGSSNDIADGHTTGLGNGQDITNVLGSIVRIDPSGTNSANGQYGIPADNPFVGVTGADEIYAYGFRNPFRFSFADNGDIYVGDVGQNDIEEVSLVAGPGGNYGWNVKEGTFCFTVDAEGTGAAVSPEGGLCPGDDGSMIDPIAQYDTHLEGHSVIGGSVYDGTLIPDLANRYVFADFSQVFVFSFNNGTINVTATPGRLFYLGDNNEILEFSGANPGGVILGMGTDAAGEMYVLGNAQGLPNGTSGTVHKISSTTPTLVPGGAGATEGDAGSTTTVEVPITLSHPATQPVTVDWTTLDLAFTGAATAGVDFVADSGSVRFSRGQSQQTVAITIIGDDVPEVPLAFGGEWVFVHFTNPSSNAYLDTSFFGLGIGVIAEDD